MITNNIIAIDGPSGSGKSTVSKKLAQKLKLLYIDTGAMYRAVTYKVGNLDLKDEEQLKKILSQTAFAYCEDNLCMDGRVLGDEIRTPQIDAAVSKVSANPIVREYLMRQQIELGKNNPSVMDGRDIGTVLFPQAILKIFLTADIQSRANRRFCQNERRGITQSNLREIAEQIEARDIFDSTREMSPLKKAEDAIEIDTSNLSVDEVVEKIEELYKERVKLCTMH
ncbi:MAG: (d)CMP kinase [Peptostreptococcaceae bacterium]|nr:(d)CMP kinase [Peptostreptococcaceae bacterium]